MSLFESFANHPDKQIMLEALLIGFVIALIGAGCYTFFISSMKNDRTDARLKNRPDPWAQANEQKATPQCRKSSSSKGIKIFVILFLVVILALICFILATSFG